MKNLLHGNGFCSGTRHWHCFRHCFGTRAHLLESLEQLVESKVDALQVISVILDGAAIVQML